MSEIGIGSVVWFYDINHREYTEPEKGRIWGRIIERKHWQPQTIVSETSRSWITNHGTKLPKDVSKWSKAWITSEAGVDDWEWMRVHKHRIADHLRHVDEIEVLKQIAALVGYEA
jgi:hypothetical protein